MVTMLFDAFVDEHAAGQHPDVREYLRRAGPGADALGQVIDRYLELAPVAPPDPETVIALNARLEHITPLTAARRALPLKVDQVVQQLGGLLGLQPALKARLRVAYQELETGQLDAAGVSDRVWDALQTILGLDPRRLVPQKAPAFPASAYLRESYAGSADDARLADPDSARMMMPRVDRPHGALDGVRKAPSQAGRRRPAVPWRRPLARFAITSRRPSDLRARYLSVFGGPEIPVPVESIAEDLLGLRIEVTWIDCSGMLLPAERLIRVNAAETSRFEPPLRRHRFTIAHELGHWICHALQGAAPAVTYCRQTDLPESLESHMRARYAPRDHLEREANTFAAGLLMPAQAVRTAWQELGDLFAIATHFDVSPTAMHWRLQGLGLEP